MKSVEYLRRDAARRACLGLAAGLATVAVAATARAEGEGGSSLSRALFAPVSPTDASAASPLASPDVQRALAAAQAERPALAARRPAAEAAAPADPAAHVAEASAATSARLSANAAIDFGYPLPGHEVNSRFGLRQLSFEPRARMHDGVDIAAPLGSQIHAAAPGVVTRTGQSSSYGNFVEVACADGLTTFYAHMSRTAGLKPGAEVSEGEVLGYVGSTGHSTGPHLHFEIRKGGEPLNPQDFMGRQFASAADLPIAEARAPGLLTRLKGRFHMLATWHGRSRSAPFRYAALHHWRGHVARG